MRCCGICPVRKVWRVHLDEPAWWYRDPPSRIATLLRPLSALYGWAAERRYFRAATPYRSRLPIICVGNFTAGGTGKTPMVIHLCATLKAAGHEPVALTRGYGGRLQGPYWVNARSDVPRDVGDEALLLARAAPTLIARDRRLGARAIESGPHPATVVVMDDGLQNPGLAKDLTIAAVDGNRGLGNGLVMPAGPLRAALGFQLELTDAIIVNGGSPDAPAAQRLRHGFAGPVLRSQLVAEGADWLVGASVVAWAGIAAPERFFAMLRSLGANVTEAVAFRDHQWLGEGEARRLLDLAQLRSATLVTTAKDMARLTGSRGATARLAAASRVLQVKQALPDAEAERLMSLIDTALQSRR
jgi:tetraacyldisaccharide 4'-kinase